MFLSDSGWIAKIKVLIPAIASSHLLFLIHFANNSIVPLEYLHFI